MQSKIRWGKTSNEMRKHSEFLLVSPNDTTRQSERDSQSTLKWSEMEWKKDENNKLHTIFFYYHFVNDRGFVWLFSFWLFYCWMLKRKHQRLYATQPQTYTRTGPIANVSLTSTEDGEAEKWWKKHIYYYLLLPSAMCFVCRIYVYILHLHFVAALLLDIVVENFFFFFFLFLFIRSSN